MIKRNHWLLAAIFIVGLVLGTLYGQAVRYKFDQQRIEEAKDHYFTVINRTEFGVYLDFKDTSDGTMVIRIYAPPNNVTEIPSWARKQ